MRDIYFLLLYLYPRCYTQIIYFCLLITASITLLVNFKATSAYETKILDIFWMDTRSTRLFKLYRLNTRWWVQLFFKIFAIKSGIYIFFGSLAANLFDKYIFLYFYIDMILKFHSTITPVFSYLHKYRLNVYLHYYFRLVTIFDLFSGRPI